MLMSISPIDGRYKRKTEKLGKYFSEFALIKYRVFVEIQYFIALANHPIPQLENLTEEHIDQLNAIYENFSIEDAQRIKDIEKITNHDVKAVEYFLKEQFNRLGISEFKEFIHFGLTSQDINNTAIPLSFKEGMHDVIIPTIEKLIAQILVYAKAWQNIPMLARTHGQPATPTTLGKEFMVFIERLQTQLEIIKQLPYKAKFGGATGNFNAHIVAFPSIDWIQFGNNFVNEYLGLQRSQFTTQIAHYDNLAASFHAMSRINTILIDMARDIWTYISMEYFKQKVIKNEVGSSTMPHKVNPIDFENAEGNLGISNALLLHLASKLPISRLQRDLTDSTVLRNIGVPYAHALIALLSLEKGLDKLVLNESKLNNDLENNWMVVSEAIQTILRREGIDNPYEQLKSLTRGANIISKNEIHQFIDELEINESIKDELKTITPQNYLGVF